MLKSLLVYSIRKLKNNDNFSFDPQLSDYHLIFFVFQKGISFIRGLRILFVGKLPKLLFLGRSVRLLYQSKIILGRNITLHEGVLISALCNDVVSLGSNVNIGAYSRIVAATSFNNLGKYIYIGDNVGIGEFSYLGGGGGLCIGDDTIIGQYFSAHPENHIFLDKNILIRKQGVTRQGIKIGRNCWIGSKVTILDGVTIGNNCVIAAGAVVTRSFKDNLVIGGVPAIKIKELS